MTGTLRRFSALRAGDRSLVLEAAIALIVVRAGLAVFGFARVRRGIDRVACRFSLQQTTPTSDAAPRVAWSIAAVTRRLPFRSTCLVESLAVDAMLRRRGVASEVRFGVRPPDGGMLAAHAWVEHDGVVVFGARPDLSEYAVLVPQDAR